MNNKKKIIIALSLIGTFAYSNAFAATAVVMPSQMAQIVAGLSGIQTAVTGGFATYFNPVSGVYTKAAAQMAQQQTNALDGIQNTQQIQITQQEQAQEKQDYRNRASTGMAKIAELDNAQRPTIQQCIEASKSAYRGGAGSASFGGGWSRGSSTGGGAGGKSTVNINDVQDKLTTTSSLLAEPLKAMKENDTCSSKFGTAAQCGGGNGEYSEGDIKPQGLKYNIANSQKVNTKQDFANWSLDQKAYNVASLNIINSAYSQAPKAYAKAEDWKNNPVYVGMYRQVISKLNASAETLLDIVNFRNATQELSDTVKTKWANDTKSKYAQVFPNQKFPTNPSLYEVVNFDVYNDYIGPADTKTLSPEEQQKELSRKLTLANFIAWKQYNATENTNILLSHLLTQAVTPIDVRQVNSEYDRTKSTTPK